MNPSIEINLPIQRVAELYTDKNNFQHWKKGFTSFEMVSGSSNEVGSVCKLYFKKETIIETITSNNLPFEISQEYEHKNGEKTIMFHTAVNRFIAVTESRTLIEMEMKVSDVTGFILKLMIKMMAGAGRRYAQDQLIQFKGFAENQHSL